MRILLTNDDGIRAPGLHALFEALVENASNEPFIVAPLTVQSATAHGVTFHEPLMIRTERINERMSGIAVDGRPADCVKLAISSLWPERFGAGTKPELLISGMNAGANCGINVIYSGTVAAALEGAFLGVPSIAVSLHLGKNPPLFDLAARRARTVIDRIVANGLGAHECINVNIPITEANGPMPALRVCRMNTHGLIDQYERRVSPAGDAYYWPSGSGLDFHGTDHGSDVDELFRACITVTPLHHDLTDHSGAERWQKLLAHRPTN